VELVSDAFEKLAAFGVFLHQEVPDVIYRRRFKE